MDKETEKFNVAMLHMLVVQQAQLHALRDFALTYITSTSGLNQQQKNYVKEQYEKKVEEGVQNAKAQLQAHYLTDFDVDDLLKGLFSK